jgi:hypothetical protein
MFSRSHVVALEIIGATNFLLDANGNRVDHPGGKLAIPTIGHCRASHVHYGSEADMCSAQAMSAMGQKRTCRPNRSTVWPRSFQIHFEWVARCELAAMFSENGHPRAAHRATLCRKKAPPKRGFLCIGPSISARSSEWPLKKAATACCREIALAEGSRCRSCRSCWRPGR